MFAADALMVRLTLSPVGSERSTVVVALGGPNNAQTFYQQTSVDSSPV